MAARPASPRISRCFRSTGYTTVALMNSDPPFLMPIAKAMKERIPAK